MPVKGCTSLQFSSDQSSTSRHIKFDSTRLVNHHWAWVATPGVVSLTGLCVWSHKQVFTPRRPDLSSQWSEDQQYARTCDHDAILDWFTITNFSFRQIVIVLNTQKMIRPITCRNDTAGHILQSTKFNSSKFSSAASLVEWHSVTHELTKGRRVKDFLSWLALWFHEGLDTRVSQTRSERQQKVCSKTFRRLWHFQFINTKKVLTNWKCRRWPWWNVFEQTFCWRSLRVWETIVSRPEITQACLSWRKSDRSILSEPRRQQELVPIMKPPWLARCSYISPFFYPTSSSMYTTEFSSRSSSKRYFIYTTWPTELKVRSSNEEPPRVMMSPSKSGSLLPHGQFGLSQWFTHKCISSDWTLYWPDLCTMQLSPLISHFKMGPVCFFKLRTLAVGQRSARHLSPASVLNKIIHVRCTYLSQFYIH